VIVSRRRLALAAKRAIDVVGSATGLTVLSPLLAGTSLALLATQGRPVLFRQQRPGLGGRPFWIYKFRTMRPPRPGEVSYLTDEQRMTRLGRFLRTSSLDELPELWNVLRGDMSLVGPRPLLMEYLDKYTPEERRRHDLPAGLTGWAAVNGRHALRFKERLKLDVWYVDHWSLWLDLKILAMTVAQVVARRDVAAAQAVEDIGFPLPTAAAVPAAAAPDGARAQGARCDLG
jgi:lipopolysaccharide/colanic/teichoic acid biosynthesis glycosyltransferase